jgi:hypothetical protein
MARLARVAISTDLLTKMLTRGGVFTSTTARGLPAGARYVRCYDPPHVDGLIWFVFEHESFGEVPEGHVIPEARILLETEGL